MDNDRLQFIKATETLEQAMFWAELIIPKSDYLVTGLENKCFSVYTEYELRILYYNTSGEMPPENMEYNKLMKGVAYLAGQLEVDLTEVWQLKGQLGHDLTKPDLTPAPEKEKPSRKPPGQGSGGVPTRPKEGTATGRVWAIADACYEANGKATPDRADVIAKATAEGINPSTVATQFAKWKRSVQDA
jgi:hypothetical protein